MRSSFWQEKIKFGNLNIPRFMSAPIDGITDSPMRQLIREFSPEILLFTEMRHVACVVNEKNGKSLKYNPVEHPVCFQVSANSTDFIESAIEKTVNKKFDSINLNIGCPAKNIIKSGCGSALMDDLPKLKKIIKELKKSIDNKVSLTVKMRAGFKKKNGQDVALLCQDEGVDAIIIHPRTQEGGFAAPLDFELVRKIKESIKIPVIFSGNINNFETTKKTYELTGVNGFMIGRALYGCPWKIKEIMGNSQGKSFEVPEELSLKIALKHLSLVSDFYGKQCGFKLLKQHLPQYIKNLPEASKIRKELMLSNSEEEMRNILNKLLLKS